MNPRANSQAILLVEDEQDDVFFMGRALEKSGIASALRVAEDGAEAIDYLSGKGDYADRAKYPLPALILLDLKLPRVMGMDVLKWYREQPDSEMTVVIVLTSSQQRSDIRQACLLGANSYLVKPSNPQNLFELTELIKSYWLQLNQPTASTPTSADSPSQTG